MINIAERDCRVDPFPRHGFDHHIDLFAVHQVPEQVAPAIPVIIGTSGRAVYDGVYYAEALIRARSGVGWHTVQPDAFGTHEGVLFGYLEGEVSHGSAHDAFCATGDHVDVW